MRHLRNRRTTTNVPVYACTSLTMNTVVQRWGLSRKEYKII